jgi:hypothetical protein
MDIMNNMTVSTSKLTFSLIAISALLVSGSGFMIQEATAADPTFTAQHINSTTTQITFDQIVNGTLSTSDWIIKLTSTQVPGTTSTDVALVNVTSGLVESSGEKTLSQLIDINSFGFLNASTTLFLVHDAIPTDATYFINYTQTTADHSAHAGQFQEAHLLGADADPTKKEKLIIGGNATAVDWMSPTAVSSQILKSNPNRVEITMSEVVVNLNSTSNGSDFTILKTSASSGVASTSLTPTNLIAENSTKFIYLDFSGTVSPGDVLTVSYLTSNAAGATNGGNWITDGLRTDRYGSQTATSSATDYHQGNRMMNFSGSTLVNYVGVDANKDAGSRITNLAVNVVNWLQLGMFGDVTTCYDCEAPVVTKVEVSLDSSTPITVNDNNKVHINAGIGDTVSVMVTIADNLGADTIPFAGIYTNFGDTPDNLFYANNFDSTKQMSTSYYEWNVRSDDVAFDNNGAITWNDATAKVNPDRTQTFTYTMTINDSVDSSQVWVDIADKVGNYAKVALPITLEVSGAPGLTFASDDTQKVVSFFNESILLAIVSQWTATSSDDATNVEQLSSVLGIESQLPTWTTDLASWVADEKIDVADMIVAVEYVINQ